jgi:hypothetical protein
MEVLRMLMNRREELPRQRMKVVNRPQRLLVELTSMHAARWDS